MQLKGKIKRPKLASNASGFIIWEGNSPVDGAPIVAIATMESGNEKTGNMIQTWIMRTDLPPHEAVKNGADVTVCGNCKLRNGKGCYVLPHQGPLSIWNAWLKGNYLPATVADLALIGAGREVRLGAYGDPAMVPTYVWQALISKAKGWTGYTHQWRESWFDPDLLKLCMASADNYHDADLLSALGIRYFLALPDGAELPEGSVQCVADTHGKQCRDCLLCDGGSKGKSVVVALHGVKRHKAAKILNAIPITVA